MNFTFSGFSFSQKSGRETLHNVPSKLVTSLQDWPGLKHASGSGKYLIIEGTPPGQDSLQYCTKLHSEPCRPGRVNCDDTIR